MATDTRIVQFADEHLPAAAGLLSQRHARLRAGEPGLAERWCGPDEGVTLLAAARARPRARGYAALEAGRLISFLVGEVRLDAPWDRAGWVELAGHATAEDQPGVAHDLYAAWSSELVNELGIFRYLVNVPAGDRDAVEAWHQLNFGQMHAYALRSTDVSDLPVPPADIVIRDATPDDAALMESTSELIWREQVGAPSWSPIRPEQIAALRDEYVEELTLPEDRVWVAQDAASGDPLGVSVSYRLDPSWTCPTTT